ncbi:hypothetical protein SRB5_58710 [Streptomyces sp. RB5]|uniref:DUF1772 domain-containing protein n=1 Tax=Streptomyces smaragdinus TaxID=2585196 RepID=A0A7K0CQT5_9ACTN|nr:DUF1772 domain-containing protein [Streptomyces smaragdinus]MQY15683.1 hypothetical protein [Streptomyces smaragdinus]
MRLKDVALSSATVLTGLSAGLYAAFSYAVMPALGRSDDRTFVVTMREINRAILNGWFVLIFLGSLAALIAAAVSHRRTRVLPWILGALGLYAVVLVVTMGLNVPLNDTLDAAGVPSSAAGLARVRADFEDPWVRWNNVRTVVNLVAFGLIAWAQRGSRPERASARTNAGASAGASTGSAKPSY